MRKKDGVIIYSPSDLVVYLESPYASWIDRRKLEGDDSLVPDEDDPLLLKVMLWKKKSFL